MTDVPETYDGFNPDGHFVILFNLRLDTRGASNFGMLSMVWKAPRLPEYGELVHVGGRLVMETMKGKPMWSDGSHATLHAKLLHLTSAQRYLDVVALLIAEQPRYQTLLHASLHIATEAHM